MPMITPWQELSRQHRTSLLLALEQHAKQGGKASEGDIGMPKDPYITYAPGQYYETAVAGGKRFFFTLAGTQWMTLCHISGSFEPIAGTDYDIIYSADQRDCSVKVTRIVVKNGRVGGVPVPSARQRAQACTFFWN